MINDFGKIGFYSPSVYQKWRQKLTVCFIKFIPKVIVTVILKEEDLVLLIEEIIIAANFGKSATEIKRYDSTEELKNPQRKKPDSPIVIYLNNLNEKGINYIRIQAVFKRSGHVTYLFS